MLDPQNDNVKDVAFETAGTFVIILFSMRTDFAAKDKSNHAVNAA